jgi:hypothetical protein
MQHKGTHSSMLTRSSYTGPPSLNSSRTWSTFASAAGSATLIVPSVRSPSADGPYAPPTSSYPLPRSSRLHPDHPSPGTRIATAGSIS